MNTLIQFPVLLTNLVPEKSLRISFFVPIAFLLLTTFFAGCSSTASLRVATYNTYLISPLMRCARGLEIDWTYLTGILTTNNAEFIECTVNAGDIAPNDAKIIAANMLNSGYDVFALNEVFDNEAKDVLVRLLETEYPYYISYFEEGSALEDSGLMIFSRFPFLPLERSVYKSKVKGTSDEVGFILFQQCSGFDCHADKGAALVRVQVDKNGGSDGIYNLVFTHLQSDEGNIAIRLDQMSAISFLLAGSLNDPRGQKVVIMGDLNVMGEGGNNGVPGFEDRATAKVVHGSGEWLEFAARLLDPVYNFTGNDRLFDAWSSYMPSQDLGITYPSSHHRYDYFIVNDDIARERGCVQQMITKYLGPSDHIALVADINAMTIFCNPRDALQNPPFNTRINSTFSGAKDITQIEKRGSMQWFHVVLTKPRTMSVAVEPAYDPDSQQGVAVELFSPFDMSTPLPNYLSEKTYLPDFEMTAEKYVVPKDFYIRVFSPNRNWKGNYTLVIHPHECQSKQDACVLLANQPQKFTDYFQANTLLGLDNTAWFQIDVTDVADSGLPQQLRLFAGDISDPNGYEFRLLDKANPAVDAILVTPSILQRAAGYEVNTPELGPLGLYMTVKRLDIALQSSLTVGWESPLTRLHGNDIGVPGAQVMTLVCKDETNGLAGNEIGEDEIHLQIDIDDTGWHQIFGADYDCNNEAVVKNVGGVYRFVDNVKIRIFEGDGDGNADDNSAGIVYPVLPLDTFAPDFDPRVINRFVWWEFEGGRYEFNFSVSHQLPPKQP